MARITIFQCGASCGKETAVMSVKQPGNSRESWILRLKGWLSGGGASKRTAGRHSTRLSVEVLEDRTLLSAIMTGPEPYRETVLATPGLVSYWELNETAGTSA